MRRVLSLLLLTGVLLATGARAHEVRPGYLELRQTAFDTYEFLFKVPALGEEFRLSLHVKLPEGTQDVAPPRALFTNGAYVERRTIRHEGALTGHPVAIEGLVATSTDVLVRVEDLAGIVQTERLTPTKASFTIKAAPGAGEVAGTYLLLGIEHILLGVDHLLFVLGLLLIVRSWSMLIKTITAFTLAHSITLAIATLGYAELPAPPLNAAIALSILFLAPEIVRTWRGETSFTIRHPWVVAFAFGLLHGFGFASGLSSVGLPKGDIPLALLMFNLGVEAGQLAFVGGILLLLKAFVLLDVKWPRLAHAAPAYIVGSLGAFWTIDRVVAMLGGTA